jgi:hypothetical protein
VEGVDDPVLEAAMSSMIRLLPLFLLGLSAAASAADPPAPKVVVGLQTMYGVDGPFVDAQLRHIPGDELPWMIRSAVGTLSDDGHLTLAVRGLVFTYDDEVPVALRGTNDEPYFRAAVSCVVENRVGGLGVRNIVSKPFAATPTGDSDIDAHLRIPEDCVAPVIFVLAGSELKSFAISGAEFTSN